MQDFFKKHGVAVMLYRELFDFIVDPTIAEESVDGYLEEVCFYLALFICAVRIKVNVFLLSTYFLGNVFQVQQKIMARGDEISPEDEMADHVFLQVHYQKILFCRRYPITDHMLIYPVFVIVLKLLMRFSV